ncbi:MAG: HAD family hydrolase, partial [Chroococcales cyanobacterium]
MTTIQCRDIKFERIEAIIFDKDGTLEDSEDFLRLLGQKRSRIIDARV